MYRIHYSWIILIISFFSIIVAGIIRSSSGVFIDPFENEFGWDRSVISFSFCHWSFFIWHIRSIYGITTRSIWVKENDGRFYDNLVDGIVLTFFMQQSWQLIIIWGIIIGLGSGLFLTVLSPYIANRWFEKKRGLVVGILTAVLQQVS